MPRASALSCGAVRAGVRHRRRRTVMYGRLTTRLSKPRRPCHGPAWLALFPASRVLMSHRVLRVCGKGGKVVLVPLPPAVARAIDGAVGDRTDGLILRNTLGLRMDRHVATRRLKHLAATAGIRMPRMHPRMLRHTFVTTMLDTGVSLRDVQIAARHADPRTTMRYDRARKNLDRHPNDILAAYMPPERNPCSRLCR